MSSDAGRAAGRRGLLIALAVLAAVLLVALVAVVAFRAGGGASAASTPSATPRPTPTTPTAAQIYDKVGPSVVVITTADGALGSGVVAAADGTILTANHVVADGSAISVRFANGSSTRALVASADAAQDIATLTPLNPSAIVPADLGGAASVGGAVVAIGNPLGLRDSVSTGVISGLDRRADTPQGQVRGLIQFDASVNPGSSGGPLLDAQGLVIGVVVAILNPAGDDSFAGIGFAVPIGAALGSAGSGDGGPQK